MNTWPFMLKLPLVAGQLMLISIRVTGTPMRSAVPRPPGVTPVRGGGRVACRP